MKKSFTLIEIIISITILSLLFFTMGNVLQNLKTTQQNLNVNIKNSNLKKTMIKTLYYDVLNSTSVKIIHSKNSDYDRLYLVTSNSLYHLTYPNVLWYVSKKDNTLIRVESPFNISLPSNDLFFLDKFLDNIEIFKIYSKKDNVFIFIKKDSPLYFEIAK